MDTLHVFAGSPKIKNTNNNTGNVSLCRDMPNYVWKTYSYRQSWLLHDCLQTVDEGLNEVCLDYKLDHSQLSDLRQSNSSTEDLLQVNKTPSQDEHKKISVQSNAAQLTVNYSNLDHTTSRNNHAVKELVDIGKNDIIQAPLYSNIKTIAEAVQFMCSSNFLVVILQINPPKRVQVKNGPNAGEFVTLSSILIGDCSYSYFSVTLWNHCAKWAESYSTGDVVILTNICIRTFRNQSVGQTSARSETYNFQMPDYPYPRTWSNIIDIEKLRATTEWARKDHYYLYVRNARNTDTSGIKDAFCDLSVEHVNNVLARVVTTTRMVGENTFKNKFLKLIRCSVELQDKHNESIALNLCEQHAFWATEFEKKKDRFVRLTSVVYKCDPHTERYSLHTTPKSTLQFVTDSLVIASITKFTCKICSVRFTDDNSLVFVLHDAVKSEDLQHLLYIGCSHCFSNVSKSSLGTYKNCVLCGNDDFIISVQSFNITIQKRHDDFQECSVLVNPSVADKIFPSFHSIDFHMLNDHPEKIVDIIQKTFHSLFTSIHEISLKEIDGCKFEEFSLVNEKVFMLVDIVKTCFTMVDSGD